MLYIYNYGKSKSHVYSWNQMAFVIIVVFINIQLITDESLSQGFPSQITKMNMFVMQQYAYSSE